MKWFKTPKSATSSPLLAAGEQLKAKSSNVNLLVSTKTVRGTLYLTTKRLIHIDRHRLAFELELPSVSTCIIEPIEPSATSSGTPSWKVYVLLQKEWICSICSFVNLASSRECAACGVWIQPDAVVSEPSLNPISQSLEPGECPQCTYMNHRSLLFCEICGSSLKPQYLEHNSQLAFEITGEDETIIMMLREMVNEQAQTSSSDVHTSSLLNGNLFGIHKLRKSSEKNHDEAQNLLESAMESRNNFLAAKLQLLALSESLGAAGASIERSDDPYLHLLETSELIKPLASLDPIPVVAGATGSHAIAQELAGLLIESNVLARFGGVLTLHDLYAIYNRARGISLIDMKALEDALAACEELDLPLKCRVHGSGLKVIESRGSFDRALAQLKHWIVTESESVSWRASAGFSARDVSERFGCSIAIATEELLVAESRGELCRDEHVTGLRFFRNLICV